MRKVFCPTEIMEIMEILLPARCAAVSAISAISAGRLLPHADSILLSHGHRLCRFARRRNIGNKGNSLTLAKSFLLFLLFLRETNTCRARIELSRRNKGNKGNSSFGCCLRSAFGLKTSGEGTSETYMRIFFAKKNATSAT